MIAVPVYSPHYNGNLCPTRINCDRLTEKIQAVNMPAAKKVYMYDLQGNYIKSFKSMKQARREMNISSHMIVACCNGTIPRNTTNLWSFSKYRVLRIVKKKVTTKGTIQQYDKDGKLVAEYITMREASEKVGVLYKSISATIRGNQKTCGGFTWKRKFEGTACTK